MNLLLVHLESKALAERTVKEAKSVARKAGHPENGAGEVDIMQHFRYDYV